MRPFLVCLLLLVGVTACASPNAKPAGGSAASRLTEQAALEAFPVGFGADGLVLRNGGTVALAADLDVEVFVDPYPASGRDVWLDLLLKRGGKAIDNAEVTSDNEMAYMSHGTTHVTGTNAGDGHYLFSMDYPMVGPWRHRIQIQFDEQHYDLPLAVTVYPA